MTLLRKKEAEPELVWPEATLLVALAGWFRGEGMPVNDAWDLAQRFVRSPACADDPREGVLFALLSEAASTGYSGAVAVILEAEEPRRE